MKMEALLLALLTVSESVRMLEASKNDWRRHYCVTCTLSNIMLRTNT